MRTSSVIDEGPTNASGRASGSGKRAHSCGTSTS